VCCFSWITNTFGVFYFKHIYDISWVLFEYGMFHKSLVTNYSWNIASHIKVERNNNNNNNNTRKYKYNSLKTGDITEHNTDAAPSRRNVSYISVSSVFSRPPRKDSDRRWVIASCPDRFTCRQRAHGTNFTRGWVDSRTVLDAVEKRQSNPHNQSLYWRAVSASTVYIHRRHLFVGHLTTLPCGLHSVEW
jgi:hypothetical protein